MDPSQFQTGARIACDAETLRRDGNPAEARKRVEEALRDDESPALHVARGLALLDLGEEPEARAALERAFSLLEGFTREIDPEMSGTSEGREAAAGEGSLDEIADAELENAFLEAESNPEEMWNANHLAEAALEQIEEGSPEGVVLGDGSPFATATVASLLEEQGHAEEAQAVREGLATVGEADTGSRENPRTRRIIATLERWLHNIRRAS